jgi:hypothetical protein
MRFQLIIQLPGDASADLDTLVALEEELIGRLGPGAQVDGHDLGASQGNIFVLTNSPADTFAHIRPLLAQNGLLGVARVAYRKLQASEFTVLWPESFPGQFVLA